MSKTSFTLSTEEKNTYGIILKTAGGDIVQFQKNPVMLFMHDDYKVIGRWENLRVENNEWVADPVFDLEDGFAKEIAGKVERNFIKAASVSVRPIEWHIEEDNEEVVVFDKWQLREASIVSIPSNHGALVRLVDENDKEIKLGEGVKLSDRFPTPQKPLKNMDLKQIAKVLNLSDDATEAEILEAIGKKSSAETELQNFKRTQAEKQKQEAVKLTDEAIADGRLKAELKDKYLKLADADFDLFKDTLSGLVKPVSLNDALRSHQQGGLPKGREAWSFSDWSQKDPDGLYNMAKGNFNKYSLLFEEAFGHKPSPEIA